jgi:uncharacterized protein
MSNDSSNLRVRVTPGAPTSKLIRFSGGVLHLKIAAPPVRGKANETLLVFLAEQLGVRKGDITLRKGAAARSKLIGISGIGQKELERRVTALLSAAGISTRPAPESRPTAD